MRSFLFLFFRGGFFFFWCALKRFISGSWSAEQRRRHDVRGLVDHGGGSGVRARHDGDIHLVPSMVRGLQRTRRQSLSQGYTGVLFIIPDLAERFLNTPTSITQIVTQIFIQNKMFREITEFTISVVTVFSKVSLYGQQRKCDVVGRQALTLCTVNSIPK